MTRKRTSHVNTIVAIALSLTAFCYTPASALARDKPAGFVKIDQPAQFSDAAEYVPVEELDLVESDPATLPLEQRLERSRPIAVTPDGQLYQGGIDPEVLKRLTSAVERIEAGRSRGVPGSLPVGDISSDFEIAADDDESVIGTDERTQITSTTSYPFRTMGRIDLGCTGTLIGPHHVLTAGHCVYDTDTDAWYQNLDFSPGQNGSSYPYGTIGWTMAISVSGWVDSHDRNYDYAMIILDENIGDRVGWMSYGYDNALPRYNVNINGYPADKPFGTLWNAYCQIASMTNERLYYPCDTNGGMSGSAVYAYWSSSNTRIIYGIHAYGVDSTGYNGATRINSSVFYNLKSWKSTY